MGYVIQGDEDDDDGSERGQRSEEERYVKNAFTEIVFTKKTYLKS